MGFEVGLVDLENFDDFDNLDDLEGDAAGRGLGRGVDSGVGLATGVIASRESKKSFFFSESVDCANVSAERANCKKKQAIQNMKNEFRTPQANKPPQIFKPVLI